MQENQPIQDKPQNHKKKWDPKDEKFLIENFKSGMTIEQIAESLGRTPFSIFSRYFTISQAGYKNTPQKTLQDFSLFYSSLEKPSFLLQDGMGEQIEKSAPSDR